MDGNHREERKPELTLDRAVKNSQAAWTKFRDAQLYAFHAAVPALILARANADEFRVFCQDRRIKGDLTETRVAELMIQNDPDADAISRERRAEYGAAIAWFADRNLCPETEADKAVELAKRSGSMGGIAALYRNHKDAENLEAAAAKEKAKATKAANGTQRKLRKNADANSADTKFQPTGLPSGSYRISGENLSLCRSKEAADSTTQDNAKISVRRLTALARELGRRLDEAGVAPFSPADLPDLGVGLYLAIQDKPTTGKTRMYEIVSTEPDYRFLVDNIIQRQQETQTRTGGQAG